MACKQNSRQCSICLEKFKQPKFLDCHHTFCLECIRGLGEKSPGSFLCPLCQKKMIIPSGGVETLTSNFYIEEDSAVQPYKTLRSLFIPYEKSTERPSPKVAVNFSDLWFEISLIERDSPLYGNVLSLRLYLPKELSPFIESCDILYDVTLVNLRDINFSIRRTGGPLTLKVQRYYGCNIDLMPAHNALDETFGFLNGNTFQVDIDIKVQERVHLNFNLKEKKIIW